MLRMLAWACLRSFWAESASALSSSMYLASRSEGLQQLGQCVHQLHSAGQCSKGVCELSSSLANAHFKRLL